MLNDAFISFTSYSKSNPVISGIVSLWGLGVITFIFREIPGHLGKIFIKQFTVRVAITSEDEAFVNVMRWYQESGQSKKSRTLRLTDCRHTRSKVLSAGLGNHYFWFNNFPYKLTRKKETTGNTHHIRESIEIVTIGRSQKSLLNLIQESNPFIDSSKLTRVYKWEEDWWNYSHEQTVRSLDSITLGKEVRSSLLNHLKDFKNDKDWYEGHGIPYRTGICLYGPPGTGKTSLVRSICGLDSRDLYILNLNGVTDQRLQDAMESVKENAVVLIEDIDSYQATNKRTKSEEKKTENSFMTKLTLSGILNAIDGISKSNGRIIIMTTNKLEAMDPALLRPGRIDLKLELGYLTEETAYEAFNRFFPGFQIPRFKPIEKLTPAQFQNIVMQHKDHPQVVFEKVRKKVGEREVSPCKMTESYN